MARLSILSAITEAVHCKCGHRHYDLAIPVKARCNTRRPWLPLPLPMLVRRPTVSWKWIIYSTRKSCMKLFPLSLTAPSPIPHPSLTARSLSMAQIWILCHDILAFRKDVALSTRSIPKRNSMLAHCFPVSKLKYWGSIIFGFGHYRHSIYF